MYNKSEAILKLDFIYIFIHSNKHKTKNSNLQITHTVHIYINSNTKSGFNKNLKHNTSFYKQPVLYARNTLSRVALIMETVLTKHYKNE